MNDALAPMTVVNWADDRIDNYPVEDLIAALLKLTDDILLNLKAGARLIASIDRRGGDVSKLPPIFLNWWRDIAAGVYLPELLVQLVAHDSLIALLRRLSFEEQTALHQGQVKLYVFGPNGTVNYRIANLLTMSPLERRQLIGANGINSEAEQRRIWELNQSPGRPVQKHWRLRPNPEADEIIVEGTNPQIRLRIRDIEEAQLQMSPKPDDLAGEKALITHLNESEYGRFLLMAAKARCKPGQLVRRILRAQGAI